MQMFVESRELENFARQGTYKKQRPTIRRTNTNKFHPAQNDNPMGITGNSVADATVEN